MAATPEEAVRLAVMNGLDMSMVPYDFSFYDHCVNLTKKDPAFVNRVNDATMRILKVKDTLGLFENAYPFPEDLNKVGSDEAWAFTLEAAQESVILAKNQDNILPLQSSAKILVAGPTANKLRVLHGGWSYTWQGNDESTFENYGRKKMTILEAIQQTIPSTPFVEGANFTDVIDINAAVSAAQNADIILLCIGEDTYTETPGNIYSLMLSDSQTELSNALLNTGKPVIVMYVGGRPRVMTDIANKAKGVVLAFLPGNRAAEAIANILFGRVNPSGRLPITYPAHPNGFTTYDHLPLEAFEFNQYEPLFPFGHGLSYTTFEYSALTLSTRDLLAPNNLVVSVTVKNSGTQAGKESVLLYLNDVYGSIPRPMRQLKKFTKISLNAGQSQTVTFTLTMDDLSFINAQNQRVYEPGEFNVYVGSESTSFVLRVNDVPTTPTAATRTLFFTTPNKAASLHFSMNIVILSCLTVISLVLSYF